MPSLFLCSFSDFLSFKFHAVGLLRHFKADGFLDKKIEKMKAELSKVLRDAGYANAAEFFTEPFAVREEKRRYEEACKVWQGEGIKAGIRSNSGAYFNEETVIRKENRGR